MGIKDLWSEALGNINKQPSVPFTTARGNTIGIDISVWLHKNIHTDLNAQCLLAHPPYPPTNLVTSIKCLHKNLVKAGVIPYYVFDGSRHPMKSDTHQQRLEKAREHIGNFYLRGRNGETIDEEHRIKLLNMHWTLRSQQSKSLVKLY
jgi:5'-3' exonuclease